MIQYTASSDHTINNFITIPSYTSLINTNVLSLQKIIIALQKQEPITSELFNIFQALINNILLSSIYIYTSKQKDIIYQINILKGQSIPSLLFILYTEHVIPVIVLPKYILLYKKLLFQLIPKYIIPFDQINNTNALVPIVTELLSIPSKPIQLKQLSNKLVIEPIKNVTSNFQLYLSISGLIILIVMIIILVINKNINLTH